MPTEKSSKKMLSIKGLSRMLPEMEDLENSLLQKGYSSIAGTDEVGRGPLAGPVVAAAVILNREIIIDGIDDSKKLSPKRREMLFEEIVQSGAVCSIGMIDNNDIDKLNILKASLLAMRKAVNSLERPADFVLVDGNQPIPNIELPQFSIVGGDALCCSISAASIIAKVTRDRIMVDYQKQYPQFSFAKHKGYPTRLHLEELREHGPTPIHRQSFRPVFEIINQTSFDI